MTYRLQERFSRNGHHMLIQPFVGMGGGLEDLFLWCQTCDPEGNGMEGGKIDLYHSGVTEGTIREAQLQLRKLALKHSSKRL